MNKLENASGLVDNFDPLISDDVILLIIEFYDEQFKKLFEMREAIEKEYINKIETLRQACRADGPMNEWVVAFRKAGVNKTPELVEKVSKKMWELASR